MAETTGISWTDSTFNPWIGCTECGPGCDNCYARALAVARLGVQWGDAAPRKRTSEAYWQQPITWNNHARAFIEKHGRRQRVFAASLADIFDKKAPPEWRADFWALVHRTPLLDWIIVTKRSGNVLKMLPERWGPDFRHVRLVFTVCNQVELNRDGPRILTIGSIFPWLRIGLSVEPMLGPLRIDGLRPGACVVCGGSGEETLGVCDNCAGRGRDEKNRGIYEIFCGGESEQGQGLRPVEVLQLRWVRDLRDQCEALNISFHFKQWGAFIPGSQFTREIMTPHLNKIMIGPEIENERYLKLGASNTGRKLDGIEHNGTPVP